MQRSKYPHLGCNQKYVLVELLEDGPAYSVRQLAARIAVKQGRDGVDSSFYSGFVAATRKLVARQYVRRTWPHAYQDPKAVQNGALNELTEKGERVAKELKADGWTVSIPFWRDAIHNKYRGQEEGSA